MIKKHVTQHKNNEAFPKQVITILKYRYSDKQAQNISRSPPQHTVSSTRSHNTHNFSEAVLQTTEIIILWSATTQHCKPQDIILRRDYKLHKHKSNHKPLWLVSTYCRCWNKQHNMAVSVV